MKNEKRREKGSSSIWVAGPPPLHILRGRGARYPNGTWTEKGNLSFGVFALALSKTLGKNALNFFGDNIYIFDEIRRKREGEKRIEYTGGEDNPVRQWFYGVVGFLFFLLICFDSDKVLLKTKQNSNGITGTMDSKDSNWLSYPWIATLKRKTPFVTKLWNISSL